MGKQNLITIQLLAITGILASILVSIIAFRNFVLPSSKADLNVVRTDLITPYVRLDQVSSMGDEIVDVAVLVNTGGVSVMAADIVVDYDPEILEPVIDPVTSSGPLTTFQVNNAGNGVIDFSQFSSRQRSEELLQTNADQEMVIAHLKFTRKNFNTELAIVTPRFNAGDLTDTNLALATPERTETITDVLQSVDGVYVKLR